MRLMLHLGRCGLVVGVLRVGLHGIILEKRLPIFRAILHWLLRGVLPEMRFWRLPLMASKMLRGGTETRRQRKWQWLLRSPILSIAAVSTSECVPCGCHL